MRTLSRSTPPPVMRLRVASAKNAHVTVMVVSAARAVIAMNVEIARIAPLTKTGRTRALLFPRPVKSKPLTQRSSLQPPAHLRCPHR